MRRLLIAALAAATTVSVFAITGTVVTEGGSKTGVVKWSNKNKAYVVSQKQGGAMIDVDVPLADVVELDIPKPAGFDQAVQQVMSGKGAAAVPALLKITKEYEHLQWDKPAGRWLAEAHLAAGNADAALKACREIIDGDASAAYKGELAPAYWNALMQAGQTQKLEAALTKAAASGDRYSSAAALVMRGDIVLKAGNDSADASRKALTDGYLRVVYLYADAPAAAVRAEALYKAGRCFEKLGQSARADAMRTQLKQQYASSPWASK